MCKISVIVFALIFPCSFGSSVAAQIRPITDYVFREESPTPKGKVKNIEEYSCEDAGSKHCVCTFVAVYDTLVGIWETKRLDSGRVTSKLMNYYDNQHRLKCSVLKDRKGDTVRLVVYEGDTIHNTLTSTEYNGAGKVQGMTKYTFVDGMLWARRSLYAVLPEVSNGWSAQRFDSKMRVIERRELKADSTVRYSDVTTYDDENRSYTTTSLDNKIYVKNDSLDHPLELQMSDLHDRIIHQFTFSYVYDGQGNIVEQRQSMDGAGWSFDRFIITYY